MAEAFSDRLHDRLFGISAPNNNPAPTSGGTPSSDPIFYNLRNKINTPHTVDPTCKLHHPNQVTRLGNDMTEQDCKDCMRVTEKYGPYFDKALARYGNMNPTAAHNLKYVLLALACSESHLNPQAVARDGYGNNLAYGLMQIYHTHLQEAAFKTAYHLNTVNARLDTPVAIQNNVNAGTDIFINFLRMYEKHPELDPKAAGPLMNAIGAYKGCTYPDSHIVNWSHPLGPSNILYVTYNVLACFFKMIGGQTMLTRTSGVPLADIGNTPLVKGV